MIPLKPLLVCLALFGLGLVATAALQSSTKDVSVPEKLGPLTIERAGASSLEVPRDETLVYAVTVDLGLFAPTAGTVSMSARVEPWQPSLLFGGMIGGAAGGAVDAAVAPNGASAEAASAETGVYTIHAKGKYSWYSLDATIETRILPQEWPRISYLYTHKGSEQRRRETLLGLRSEVSRASYRGDTKKNAPRGQRVWRERVYREVPGETVDMLSAVYLSRRMIESGGKEMTFPLIDKLRLWKMRLERGEEARVTVAAGSFDCVRLELSPTPWPGENDDLDGQAAENFEGLFGLAGSIVLYVEKLTGVPVKIQGDLPMGPFTFEISVDLKSHAGTPSAFAAVAR